MNFFGRQAEDVSDFAKKQSESVPRQREVPRDASMVEQTVVTDEKPATTGDCLYANNQQKTASAIAYKALNKIASRLHKLAYDPMGDFNSVTTANAYRNNTNSAPVTSPTATMPTMAPDPRHAGVGMVNNLSYDDPQKNAQRGADPGLSGTGFWVGLREGGKAAMNGMVQGVLDIPESIIRVPAGIVNAPNYPLKWAGQALEWGANKVGLNPNNSHPISGYFDRSIQGVKQGAQNVVDATGITAARKYYDDFYARDPNTGVRPEDLRLASWGGRFLPSAVMINMAAGNAGQHSKTFATKVRELQYPIKREYVDAVVNHLPGQSTKVVQMAKQGYNAYSKFGKNHGDQFRVAGNVGKALDAAGVPGGKLMATVGNRGRQLTNLNVGGNTLVAEAGSAE